MNLKFVWRIRSLRLTMEIYTAFTENIRPEESSFAYVGLGDLTTHICRSCMLYIPSLPTCHLPSLKRKIYAFQQVIPAVNRKSPSKIINTALFPNKLQYSQC